MFYLVLFRIYDYNDDGFIDSKELFELMKILVGGKFKDTEIQEIVQETLQEVCVEQPGKMSFKEFSQVNLYQIYSYHEIVDF